MKIILSIYWLVENFKLFPGEEKFNGNGGFFRPIVNNEGC